MGRAGKVKFWKDKFGQQRQSPLMAKRTRAVMRAVAQRRVSGILNEFDN